MTKQTANIDDSFAGLYILCNEMFSKLNISVFDKRSKVASRGLCVMLYFLSQPSSGSF